jgi:hypothetical protein
MNLKAFQRAEQLYAVIHNTKYYIKDITYYEQHHYKKGVPLVLKVPWSVGICAVDCDIAITDKELIKEVLNSIKIRHACALMKRGCHTISEVASSCGFSSTSYFCKVFKRTTNLSPMEFIKNAKIG